MHGNRSYYNAQQLRFCEKFAFFHVQEQKRYLLICKFIILFKIISVTYNIILFWWPNGQTVLKKEQKVLIPGPDTLLQRVVRQTG